MDANLETILKDSEWTPKESTSSDKWKKIKSYYVYLSPPKLEYKIDQKLIDTMDKYNAIYKLGKSKFVPSIIASNVSKVFKIFDKSGLVLYGYSNMSVLRYIKSNLQRYLRGVSSPFDSFDDIKKIKVQLITVIHGADRADLDMIKTKLKEKHLERDIESYIESYNDIIKKFKLSQKVGYIYILSNSKTEKNYIGASNINITESNKKAIINHIIKTHKNIKRTKGVIYDIKSLCKIKYSTKIGLSMIIDKYINKYDSIDNGYNTNFRYVHKLRRKVEEQLDKDIREELNMEYDK